MDIKLWKNFSKRRNSTKQPPEEGAVTKSVRLKEDTSLENPSFIINEVDFEYNYVQAMGHYYFVSDVVALTNSMSEIRCEQDVLATHKTAIGNYSAFIDRAQTGFNAYINDVALSSVQKLKKLTLEKTQLTGIEGGAGCYIIRIVGNGVGGVGTYAVQNLTSLAAMFDPEHYYEPSDPDDWANLLCNAIVNPMQYLLSIKWCPLPYSLVATQGTFHVINVKWYTTPIGGVLLNEGAMLNSITSITMPAKVYNDFRDYNPNYTRYSLYLPAIGEVQLSSDVTQYNISVEHYIDLTTGDVFYELFALSGLEQSLIATYNGNIYSNIQIGSDSVNASSLYSSGLSLIGSVASENGIGIAESGFNAIQNVFSPTPSVIGNVESGIALRGEHNAVVSQYVYETAEFSTPVEGRPVCKNQAISTHTGYVKCRNASISIDGMASDRDAVNSFLNGGFYYE